MFRLLCVEERSDVLAEVADGVGVRLTTVTLVRFGAGCASFGVVGAVEVGAVGRARWSALWIALRASESAECGRITTTAFFPCDGERRSSV